MRQRSSHRPGFAAVIGGLLLLLPLTLAADAVGVRPAAKAGSWYPAQPAMLQTLIDRLLAQAAAEPLPADAAIRALIVPHAAYAYSGATAAAAYRRLQGRSYRRVILLGPAHRALQERGLYILEVDAYATPLGRVPLDRAAITSLRQHPLVHQQPALHAQEHSLEIQLPFLQRVLEPGWQLLPILVGDMQQEDYPQAVEALQPLLDEQTLLVISTDFTHYGAAFRYLPFPADGRIAQRIRELDMGAFEYISARDPEGFLAYRRNTGITVCGYRPVALLLHLLPSDARVKLLQYTSSGGQSGDYRHSVSYIAALVTQAVQEKDPGVNSSDDLSEQQLQYLHALAQLTLRARVREDAAAEQALQALSLIHI